MAVRLGDVAVFLRANSDQLQRDLNNAKGSVTNWASGLAGSMKGLIGGAVLGGVAALGTAVVGIGTAAFTAASDFDAAQKKIQSQLGLTEEQAAKAGQAVQDVFKNNFGSSIEDVAQSVTEVEQAFAKLGGAGDNLQSATESALALRDAFGIQVVESAEAAAELMDKFGLTSEQAFDFIASGFQKGLNSSDDFLDSITEYSTQFSNGGADAAQFFSILQTGLQAGALGTDKAADAFKEFRLRINDGSTLTATGLQMLGLNVEQFTSQLADGSLSTADAFDIVLGKLREIEDPTVRMQAGVALIGTQFEDLGDSAVAALSLTSTSLADLVGATDKLQKQYATIPSFFEGLRRRAVVAIAPLGEALLGSFNAALPSIEQWFTTVETWIADFIANSNFEWSPEFKQIKLGDLFEFIRDGASTTINLGDYVSFTYDSATSAVALTLGDVFSFTSTDEGALINLADYVTFIYDAKTGNVALTLGDVFSFVSDAGGTVINLQDYVSFVYDTSSGGVALTLGDVFSFVQAGDITTINLQDYVRFTWGDGELRKLTLADFFDFSSKDGVGIARFDLQDFLWGSGGKTTQAELFDFGQKVKTAAYGLADFFGWSGAGETKISSDDLFDLSGGTKPRPFALSDFFGWMGADVVKITYGDLFDLTVGKGIDKLQIGDFINLESVSADALFGSALSELSKGLGQSLADAASNLGTALEAPAWVQSLIDWKPSDGPPQWVANLLAWKIPDVPAVIAQLLAWVWPGAPTEIGDILKWVWPDAPPSIATLVSWAWPEFSATVTSAINRITNFKFPELKAPAWLDRLTSFSIPAPAWVTALLNWTPSLPSWLGGGGASTSRGDERSLFGGGAAAGAVTVNLGPVYVSSQEDAEAIAYKVARRLGGRI